jgi:hypothetical protein
MAWDIYEEIAASDNTSASVPGLDQASNVSAICHDYCRRPFDVVRANKAITGCVCNMTTVLLLH